MSTRQDEWQDAVHLLLENRWILRRENPEGFFLIRRYERELSDFFRERCAWVLQRNSQYFKLEKVPAVPRPFMGMEGMQGVEDYTLLCCVLAFLEDQEIGGQFLLSELLDALPSLYPEEAAIKLSWESYSWRKSLVRVIYMLSDMHAIRIVEDESDDFLKNGMTENGAAGEALYELDVVARSVLRQFPDAVQHYHGASEFAGADMLTATGAAAEDAHVRRARVYRRLLLEPAYVRRPGDPLAEEDFAYLRNQFKRVRDICHDRLDLELEMYQDTALLVPIDQSGWLTDVFPVSMKGIHEVILHLSHVMRQQIGKRKDFLFTRTDFVRFLEEVKKDRGAGWTKEYRDMPMEKLADDILSEMEGWSMAEVSEDGLIQILPPFFRICGEYEGSLPAKKGGKETEDGE